VLIQAWKGRLASQPFCRRAVPLEERSAELVGVKRHKFPDAHRRMAGHPLDAVRLSVITTCPVQPAYRCKMPRQMFRHTYLFQLLFPLPGVDVKRGRILPSGRSSHNNDKLFTP